MVKRSIWAAARLTQFTQAAEVSPSKVAQPTSASGCGQALVRSIATGDLPQHFNANGQAVKDGIAGDFKIGEARVQASICRCVRETGDVHGVVRDSCGKIRTQRIGGHQSTFDDGCQVLFR